MLQDIATKLFAMASSSAASERIFSTFWFVHSKLRNSLVAEKVQKLMFIKTNYPAFAETLVEYSDDESSSDPENEEVEINET
jgi:hAT family C-terminal dimerisation region